MHVFLLPTIRLTAGWAGPVHVGGPRPPPNQTTDASVAVGDRDDEWTLLRQGR